MLFLGVWYWAGAKQIPNRAIWPTLAKPTCLEFWEHLKKNVLTFFKENSFNFNFFSFGVICDLHIYWHLPYYIGTNFPLKTKKSLKKLSLQSSDLDTLVAFAMDQ